ncbi:MAG: exodeoxyribonuclease VII large subunit, partial [Gammaproteobacteria bacterium]
NGLQVIAKAQVTLYEPRGDYQLVVDALEEAGDGLLRQAFETMKLKLSQQGLFDPSHKKPIPTLPTCIGVITSPTGAAVRDILTVLRRRFPAIPVILYPVAVQGEQAKLDIVRALSLANNQKRCDVLILGRGGGSLEDLWAFNEESVAYAIYASETPIITGIGHEIDITIADFVADLRAATPSAAAEHAAPDQREWFNRFEALELKLCKLLQRMLSQKNQTLNWLSKRLEQQHPGQKLTRNAQRLDELELRLVRGIQNRLRHARIKLDSRSDTLRQLNPMIRIKTLALQQQQLQRRLASVFSHNLERLKQQLATASQTLHAVSPLATLNRGYALVTNPKSGAVIHSTEQLGPGDRVLTRLAHGRFTSQIETIIDD